MNDALFDLGASYEQMLDCGISLSGESQEYFIAGRIADLVRHLPPTFLPTRVLDFGCGVGKTTARLAEAFPSAHVTGVDIAEGALVRAAVEHASARVDFRSVESLQPDETFDLCHASGVVHHIQPAARLDVVRRLYCALAPGAFVAIFENNPWNPGTRLVMRRIPFDRDAHPLSAPTLRRLLRDGGFHVHDPARFLFYFPHCLAFLRRAEPALARLPLGAQYWVLAQK